MRKPIAVAPVAMPSKNAMIDPNDTAETYLSAIQGYLDNRQQDCPRYLTTGMQMYTTPHTVVPFDIWRDVMIGAMQMPFDGIILWYRNAVSLRISSMDIANS